MYVDNPAIQGLVRIDKTGESGILVVYKTIRQITSEMRTDRRAKTHLVNQIVCDAIGRDDMEVELVTGEDWVARSESADCIFPSLTWDHVDMLGLQSARIFLVGDAARQMAPTGRSTRYQWF
jgi:hypothetical protein